MGSQATRAEIAYCAEKHRLSERFVEAARDIVKLQDAETKTVTSEGSGLPRLDLAMEVARKRMDEVKAAYLQHVKEHGC